MYLPEAARPIFEQFLVNNSAFWRDTDIPGAQRHGAILVDLCHDNSAYLMTNLTLAEYYRRHRPGNVVGLWASWATPCPSCDFALAVRLAKSYGVETVVNLDLWISHLRESEPCRLLLAELRSAWKGLRDSLLRQAILCYSYGGHQSIGRTIYDKLIRSVPTATIEEYSDELALEAAVTILLSQELDAFAKREGVAASVVGHWEYSPYALVAQATVKAGGHVFYQWPPVPVTVRRFSSLAELARGRPARFIETYDAAATNGNTAAHVRRFQQIATGKNLMRAFVQPTGWDCDLPRERAGFLSSLGLEPSRLTGCVLVQALSDAVHGNGDLLFDDYAHWLTETLQFASRNPHFNLLVKPHPNDAVYDRSGFIDRLRVRYAHARNIAFLGKDLDSRALVTLCDYFVTVNGTPGWEIVLAGGRTITAGPSRYSGLGISCEASSIKEYCDLLVNGAGGPPNAEEINRAASFGYFELFLGRSPSCFVPPIQIAGSKEYWEAALWALHSRFVQEDPLYRSFQHMIDEQLPILLNVDLLR